MIQTWCSVLKLQIEFLILNWLQKFSQQRANRMGPIPWHGDGCNLEVSDFITMPIDARESKV
jgi:hypothetical protein